jgi:hypothetical protein
MEVRMNTHEFAIGYSFKATRVDSNPNMADTSMDHWRVQFSKDKRQMTTYFSMGRGHNGRMPEAADVLDCLASDAAGIENAQGFEDWCSEYGYDVDSRKAERIYKTCQRQASKLKAFLGESEYEALLWNVERL